MGGALALNLTGAGRFSLDNWCAIAENRQRLSGRLFWRKADMGQCTAHVSFWGKAEMN